MLWLLRFAPILLFMLLFVGSGLYFTLAGFEDAFYQISPLMAIIPAIALGWVLHQGTHQDRMHAFLEGVRHRDIITMCIIFLLAGAFASVTQAIGSVDATVGFALSFIPTSFLLIGLFLSSGFIATAIGTSMGTVATIAPIAVALSVQGGFSAPLAVATVVGGAMFGDNLSLISDTTIAAVMSQEADPRAKLKLNAIVALMASVLTVGALFYITPHVALQPAIQLLPDYSWLLITPYIFLLVLALLGVNVFTTLVCSIVFAGIVGFISNPEFGLLFFNEQMTAGFANMHEIMLLSLMIGGLSGLSVKSTKALASFLSEHIAKRQGGTKMAQLLIAKIVSVFDILLANNTIAIIFSGEIVRDIAKKYRIPPHVSATWLDIFSCVFQGIIPYGAQILLASAIAGVSPLSVVSHVYYCYILGIVSMGYILFMPRSIR